MDPSIVDTALTSRKRKREEYKNIILLVYACVVHMVIGVVTWYHNNYFVKEPTRNWKLEHHSFLNHLYRGTDKDCIEQLRFSKNAFFNLCRILQEKDGLVRTRNVPTTKAVAMFLHILAHNLKYRVVQFSYCRYKETISRQFNDVLRAVMKLSKDYLNFQPCTLEGAEANKWIWFERCIGALDGTYIPVTVSPDERPRYRNRNGDVSTNVLAACGPNLRFIYVLPGWEGSTGDSQVLRDALRCQNKLEIPTGKYSLVDAGYTNGPGFLAPYRGTRYHLNDAHNAIEKSFGILKKRWSILRTPSFFDIKTKIRIINACFVFHNFIRDKQQTNKLLEVQDLEFLYVFYEELVHQSREGVQNNLIDDIITIQATKEWTRF
ncbi:Protein ALP1-like [Glycine soja]